MADISVILVKPLYGGNVGSVARAMKNFGFKNLILVNPCTLGKEANDMAVHAKDILKAAKIYKKFKDAIKNFDLIVGTTCESTDKDDYFLRMTVSPGGLKRKIRKAEGKVAIVFGPEDIGLTNKELERCDIGVTIPTSPEYKPMNLSHSAAVLLYELSKMDKKLIAENRARLASKREKDLITSNFSAIAEKIKYPKPADRRKIFNVMLIKLFGRAQVTGREANTLIGVLKKIKKAVK